MAKNSMTSQPKPIVGAFEEVTLPEFGGIKYLAKIDTGAYRGAVHVDQAKIRSDGSVEAVLNGKSYVLPSDLVKKVRVKSSNAQRVLRPVVKMKIVLQGKTYETWLGLTNRNKMHCPALLGRFFLRENQILVDVNQNSEYDEDIRRTTK